MIKPRFLIFFCDHLTGLAGKARICLRAMVYREDCHCLAYVTPDIRRPDFVVTIGFKNMRLHDV